MSHQPDPTHLPRFSSAPLPTIDHHSSTIDSPTPTPTPAATPTPAPQSISTLTTPQPQPHAPPHEPKRRASFSLFIRRNHRRSGSSGGTVSAGGGVSEEIKRSGSSEGGGSTVTAASGSGSGSASASGSSDAHTSTTTAAATILSQRTLIRPTREDGMVEPGDRGGQAEVQSVKIMGSKKLGSTWTRLNRSGTVTGAGGSASGSGSGDVDRGLGLGDLMDTPSSIAVMPTSQPITAALLSQPQPQPTLQSHETTAAKHLSRIATAGTIISTPSTRR
jgi:hypothetical protein